MATKRQSSKLIPVRNRAAEAANRLLKREMLAAGYAEIEEVQVTKSEIDVKDYTFEDRLVNWARVVSGRRIARNVTAAWAADYIANRNAVQFKLGLDLGLIQRRSVVDQIEQQAISEAAAQDAWLIEAAWSRLPVYDHRQALRLKYVYRLCDEVIRQRLRLRGRENVRLILWRAKMSLQQVLARVEKGATIQANNLTADESCLQSIPKGD
jgi:hypothetical protein